MTDGIHIRALGPEDIGVLENVRPDTIDNAIIPKQAQAFLNSDLHNIIVALDGDQVIGMASSVTMLHPDKQPIAFVNEVGVYDDYLRRGIGLRLTKALLDLVQPDGERDIWLATENDNVAARALYTKLGVRETRGIVVYDWGHAMDPDD